MPYEDDYKMWLEKMLIESNPDWVCDGMYDVGLTHEWCEKYCGEDSEYVTPKCLHMYYHHIARADRKDEPQTIRCPKCGRTDYIRDMEKDMGIKGSHYKYKCINCNTYIKDEPTISKMEQVDKDINVRSKTEPNLILPERMERGERFEVGETIVVMNRDDYYDLLCKSWKDESHTDTHDEAIKAMATLIKAKTEPQTDIGTSDTVYSDTAGYVPRVDMTDCSWK